MSRYKFSGHETFECRHFWLKKGFDFIDKKGVFKSDQALIELGVGKNMISSISYWMKAFGVVDSATSDLTEFGRYIFHTQGKDPYLEDIGTLYLLHHNIMKNEELASIYKMTFIDFRKTRIDSEFTSDFLYEYIIRRLKSEQLDYSEKSLKNDIKVFLKTYHASLKKDSKSIEDDFSSILIDLKYIEPIKDVFIKGEQVYRMQYNVQNGLNDLIFLYAILDSFNEERSIPVEDIQIMVADLFLCNREGTENKLISLSEKGLIVYKEDAGRKEIQIKRNLTKWDVLNKYYGTV